MQSPYLPAVLIRPHGNSLSMERALKLIQECVLESRADDEKVNVAFDDLEAMLASIDRSGE